MRVVGFTGTQAGMTRLQRRACRHLLSDFRTHGAEEFHHGDCIGADMEADDLARSMGYRIAVHPPDRPQKRAWTTELRCHVIYSPKPYLARNEDIVTVADVLLATPKERTEERRSGTWATVRRARTRAIPIWFAWPDGEVSVEHAGLKAAR